MKRNILLILFTLFLALTDFAPACPVCYGQTDSHMASAMNIAVVVLLLVTFTVLSFFVSLIVYLRKRIKLSLSNEPSNQD